MPLMIHIAGQIRSGLFLIHVKLSSWNTFPTIPSSLKCEVLPCAGAAPASWAIHVQPLQSQCTNVHIVHLCWFYTNFLSNHCNPTDLQNHSKLRWSLKTGNVYIRILSICSILCWSTASFFLASWKGQSEERSSLGYGKWFWRLLLSAPVCERQTNEHVYSVHTSTLYMCVRNTCEQLPTSPLL